jgi:ribosomal protein S18 acetylase RimI-like enzyme
MPARFIGCKGGHTMTDSIHVRLLDETNFDRLHEIDLSEHITLIYRLVNGALEPEPHDWQRTPWDQAHWQEQVAEWRANLQPEVWLGAFVDGRLTGLASLRHRLEPRMAQLTTLHVDHRFRRRGVARQLVQTVIDMAEASGAEALYVSATPSESAVGFYLSQGFQPTNTPNAQMFALEPEDIHMVRTLNPARPRPL